MATVVVLAIVSMLSSVFVAQTSDGLASAVNQSGSLRMQSYRIGMALADTSVTPSEQAARVERLVSGFEARLASPRLSRAIPTHGSNAVRQAYEKIAGLWRRDMRPSIDEHLAALRAGEGSGFTEPPPAEYLTNVDAFVAEVDALVGLLEEVAEGRIDNLRFIQGVSLLLTVLVVGVTMTVVTRGVVGPLGELLECADRARRGDFSWRAGFTGSSELGRVGVAMNLMAEDLSRMYAGLEQRVSEKTRDLERTNHSLELLYRVSKTLNGMPVSPPQLKQVLSDIQQGLDTGPVTLCLHNDPLSSRGRLTVTTRSDGEQRGACSTPGCMACREAETRHEFSLPIASGGKRSVVSWSVDDQGERFGVLIVDLRDGEDLATWQRRLLGTLAGHIGKTLALNLRQHEGRRLALHEERGILARELHDSLAQSLSYLKIQAARLAMALEGDDTASARRIQGELRQGISSAYRQLRELLTTFRLKMDGRGLEGALAATIDELEQRSVTVIELDNRLPAALLSPNEEIHVLQIVREALSNVVRHAQAAHARVRLTIGPAGVEVDIADDGSGFESGAGRVNHYGLAIMRERALTLGGTLAIEGTPGAGTRVQLRFQHRSSMESPSEPLAAAGRV